MSCETYGEVVDVGVIDCRTSRKPRECEACGETILRGHKYYRESTLFQKRWESVVRCVRCQKIYEHLCSRVGDDEWPDRKLSCGHSYEERYGEVPPDPIAALAFCTQTDAQKLLVGK